MTATSKLGLGTVQFGLAYGVSNSSGQVPNERAREILALAGAKGIGVLDTAAAYGTAEAVLGDLVAPGAPFRIMTKTARLAAGLGSVIARARHSLELLRRPMIDTLLVHSAPDLAGHAGDALWTALLRLRDDGLYRRIGISAYAADDPAALAERFRPDVMQVPLSLIDQRLVASGALARLKGLGVEVHARSLFLQGLVFVELGRVPPRLQHAVPKLAAVRQAIADAGSTPLAACLAFALARPEVDVAVVGVTSPAELAGIIDAAARPCPALDWPSLAIDDPVVVTPSLW